MSILRTMGYFLLFYAGARSISTLFGLISWDFTVAILSQKGINWISEAIFLAIGWSFSAIEAFIGIKLIERDFNK